MSSGRQPRSLSPDDQAQKEQNHADVLRQCHPREDRSLVTSQSLDGPPCHWVKHHQQRHHLAIATPAREIRTKDRKDDHAREGRVKLGRVDGQGEFGGQWKDSPFDLPLPGVRARWKTHGPGQLARGTKAAAPKEATHPSQGDPQGHRGGNGVGHRPERKPASPPVPERACEPPHDTPIENTAALPAQNQIRRRVNSLGTLDHEKNACPHDSPKEEPGGQPVNVAHSQPFAFGPPGCDPERPRAGQEDHHSIGVNLEVPSRQLVQDWLHPC